MLRIKTLRVPATEMEASEVIIGDICVFRFPARDERRVVGSRHTKTIDGQECVRVVYVDGSTSVYANWVKLLVEVRN